MKLRDVKKLYKVLFKLGFFCCCCGFGRDLTSKGETTTIIGVKNHHFSSYLAEFMLACENSRPSSRNATRAGSEEGRLFSQAKFMWR